MISAQPHTISSPWGSMADWQAANRSIDFHLRRYSADFKHTETLVRRLTSGLESLASIFEELCVQTCIFCPDPCCRAAKVWFDFQDLLFLHISSQPVPLAQPLTDLKSTCRYLSHKGCALPRLVRPWICTWYLCPVQKSNMKSRSSFHLRIINQRVQQIKKYRKELEAEYIRIVS